MLHAPSGQLLASMIRRRGSQEQIPSAPGRSDRGEFQLIRGRDSLVSHGRRSRSQRTSLSWIWLERVDRASRYRMMRVRCQASLRTAVLRSGCGCRALRDRKSTIPFFTERQREQSMSAHGGRLPQGVTGCVSVELGGGHTRPVAGLIEAGCPSACNLIRGRHSGNHGYQTTDTGSVHLARLHHRGTHAGVPR